LSDQIIHADAAAAGADVSGEDAVLTRDQADRLRPRLLELAALLGGFAERGPACPAAATVVER
jgi:hypothetical protein